MFKLSVNNRIQNFYYVKDYKRTAALWNFFHEGSSFLHLSIQVGCRLQVISIPKYKGKMNIYYDV
jgi:hypothetical protein